MRCSNTTTSLISTRLISKTRWKYRYNLDATGDEIVEYLKVWAAQGLRHPESYLASLFSIAGYYVAPCGPANIRMVTVDTHMGEDDRYMLWNPEELDWLREGLDEAYKAVSETPGVDAPLPSGGVRVLASRGSHVRRLSASVALRGCCSRPRSSCSGSA